MRTLRKEMPRKVKPGPLQLARLVLPSHRKHRRSLYPLESANKDFTFGLLPPLKEFILQHGLLLLPVTTCRQWTIMESNLVLGIEQHTLKYGKLIAKTFLFKHPMRPNHSARVSRLVIFVLGRYSWDFHIDPLTMQVLLPMCGPRSRSLLEGALRQLFVMRCETMSILYT